MSYIGALAKVGAKPGYNGFVEWPKMGKRTPKPNSSIATSEGTSFGGTLHLSKEQYEKGMALSQKMKNMSAW